MKSQQLDPSHIMQTATAFWASKVLLTAVELDLFSALGDGSMTAAQLGAKLELHPRGTYDFFDALVALNFLDREGDGPEGRYKNTPETGAAGVGRIGPACEASPEEAAAERIIELRLSSRPDRLPCRGSATGSSGPRIGSTKSRTSSTAASASSRWSAPRRGQEPTGG